MEIFAGKWYFLNIIPECFDETFQHFFWEMIIEIGLISHNHHLLIHHSSGMKELVFSKKTNKYTFCIIAQNTYYNYFYYIHKKYIWSFCCSSEWLQTMSRNIFITWCAKNLCFDPILGHTLFAWIKPCDSIFQNMGFQGTIEWGCVQADMVHPNLSKRV